ncbi:MAG: hypothetical protein RR518_11885, partial [Coprobacillus sp.]
VAAETDIQALEKSVGEFLQVLPSKYEELVKPPSFLGVQSFDASGIVVRITAETIPTKQSAVAREVRRDLKEFLEQKGIKIS